MANLIITVIAIALVAVSAMMGTYYAGSAFLANQQVADTTTLIATGAQLQGAWKMYLATATNPLPAVPTSWNDLLNSGVISQVPEFPSPLGGIPAGKWSIAADDAGVYWAHASLGQAVGSTPNSAACLKAQQDAGVTTPSIATPANWSSATMTSPAYGNGVFGCYQFNGTTLGGPDFAGGGNGVPSPQYLFFYKLQ